MLTARVTNRTTLEHLTKSIQVIDALEESVTASWKEIVLLGFTYDQSDLLKFETICHKVRKHTLSDINRTYLLEPESNQTRIKYVATKEGNCRITQAKLQMSIPHLNVSKTLGVTLFAFSKTLNVSKLNEDEDKIFRVFDLLYQRHQKNPIPVYFIGHAKPQYFNIPLLFSEMDKLMSSSSIQKPAASSTAQITHRLAENKSIQLAQEHSEADSHSKQEIAVKKSVDQQPSVFVKMHKLSRANNRGVPTRLNDKEDQHQPYQSQKIS